MDKNNFDDLIYLLPYKISSEDQLTLIDYAYENADWGYRGRSLYDQYSGDWVCFGRVQLRQPVSETLQELKERHPDWDLNQIVFRYRLDPAIEWEWIETPITPLVKKLMSNIDNLYQKLTRVIVLVQGTKASIAPHVDSFDEVSGLQDSANHNMTLKWPLTERPGDNGAPFLMIDGKYYGYDVGDNVFAINEVDIMHGAGVAGFRRGVIFLDGVLNYENLQKESKSPAIVKELTESPMPL